MRFNRLLFSFKSVLTLLIVSGMVVLFFSCQINQSSQTESYLNLSRLTDSLKKFDSVQITLKNLDGTPIDPTFILTVKSSQDLSELSVPHYDGSSVKLLIVGYSRDTIVFESEKFYNGFKVDSTVFHIIPESNLSLTTTDTNVVEGDSLFYPKTNVTPSNLANPKLEWKSMNEDLASIDGKMIHFLKSGLARVRVRISNDPLKQVFYSITIAAKTPSSLGPPSVVVPPVGVEKITVSPKTIKIAVGGTHQFVTATITPSKVNQTVGWTCQDSSKLSISKTGELIGLKKGIVKIWATSAEDLYKSDTAEVEVTDTVKVTSIKFQIRTMDLSVGSSFTIPDIKILPLEASQLLDLSVSDLSMVRITNGKLEALKEGPAFAIAKSRQDTSFKDTLTLVIKKLIVINSVQLDLDSIRLYTGGSSSVLKATVLPNTSPQSVIWRSGDSSTASVDSLTGKVTPKKIGKTTVKVFSPIDTTKRDSLVVIVKKDTPQLSIGRLDTTISLGTTITFHPTVHQDYGKIVEFKWDLDGNNIYEGHSSDSVNSTLTFLYNQAKDIDAHFFVSDSEGNDTTITKKIHVIAGPVVLITSPLDGAYTSKNIVDVVWSIDGANQTAKIHDTINTDGPYTITRSASDGTGKIFSTSITIILDRVPPKIPTVSGTALVNTRFPNWSWKSGGGGTGNYRYKLDTADMTNSKLTTDSSFQPTSPLADGKHTLYVQERDQAGNWSISGTFDITIDATPPSAPIVTSVKALTNSPQPKWTWSTGGGGSGIYRYKLDDSLLVGQPENTSLSFLPNALVESAHTLYVQERDAQFNWSPTGKFTLTIDYTPPNPPNVSVVQSGLKPKWSWSTGGNYGAGNFRYKLDDTILTVGATENSNIAFTPLKDLSEGYHTLYVQESDVAGNWSGISKAVVAAVKIPNTLSDDEATAGFKLLFDGTIGSFVANFANYIKGDTSSITTLGSAWTVDSAKSITLMTSAVDIRSKEIFRDFDLRLDYRCNGNEGIFYRFDTRYDIAWLSGIEYSIEDNPNYTPKNSAASVYDMYPPTPPAPISYHTFNSANPWNEVRIVVVGDSVEHWMNGLKVVSFRYFSDDYFVKYASSKWPGNASTMSYAVAGDKNAGPIKKGYIGFQADHGGQWQIRNLRINSVSPKFGPP